MHRDLPAVRRADGAPARPPAGAGLGTPSLPVLGSFAGSALLDALVAGGHNFRPSRESRLKYRYYHQHRGFVEAYDEAV